MAERGAIVKNITYGVVLVILGVVLLMVNAFTHMLILGWIVRLGIGLFAVLLGFASFKSGSKGAGIIAVIFGVVFVAVPKYVSYAVWILIIGGALMIFYGINRVKKGY